MNTIEKIVERLKLTFDEVTYKETTTELIIAVTHKGKTKIFNYPESVYKSSFALYDDNAVAIQVRGMSMDILDYVTGGVN